MEFYRRHASILRVLAHPARLKILDLLTDRELTLAEVHEWVEIDSTSLARHISLLRQIGLVREHRRGRVLHFSAENRIVEPLIALLETVEPHSKSAHHAKDWPIDNDAFLKKN